MPANPVVLIDTSVFAALIGVPGRDSSHEAVVVEFTRRTRAGVQFVLPITTIIETGNLIANASGDRRSAGQRLVAAIEQARTASPPWTIREVAWNDDFLNALLHGDSTGRSFVDLLGAGALGGGDVAILVERDQFRASTAYGDVTVWSEDRELHAYGS